MRSIKKIIGIGIVLILIFYLIVYYENLTFSEMQKNKTVLVIGGMTNGDYWSTVKMGAKAAADESNVVFNYMATKDEGDVQGQINIINDALDKGVNALVVAPNDYTRLAKVIERAYNKNIPVIIMNSKVDTYKFNSYISADNVDEGKKAGDMLVSILGKKFKVGIMSSIEVGDSSKEKEKGVMDLFSEYKEINVVAKGYCLSNIAIAEDLTKKMIAENNDLEAMVALNSTAAEGVAEALDEMNLEGKVKVIAFDNTLKEIDYLEKGIISAIVIHDPFTMGYLSVKYAIDALNKKNIPKEIKIESKIIDGTNMYFQENEKFLFPVVR